MKDIEQMQGVWKIVSLEMDGQSISPSLLEGAQIVVEGDRFTSSGMGAPYEGTIEIDSSTTPKNFNLTFAAGPEKGNTNLGIYELDGDRWRICLNTSGTTRPSQFAAEAGTGIALEVLQRATA